MLSENFKPKRTAAASRGFLATARLSCSLTYLSRWPPNAHCLTADDAFMNDPVCTLQQSIADDAVDQWRKHLRCCKLHGNEWPSLRTFAVTGTCC